MRMPFGKYRGTDLADIDDLSYFAWVLDNVRTLDPFLREAIRRRLLSEGNPSTCLPLDPQRTADVVRDGVREVYRAASYRFHPDHGGSTDAMIAVNFMYEQLNETLPRRLRDLVGACR